MSETYIVIVLVPTRTPFSAARRSGNRCGAYCGQDNHSGAALPLLPNLYRAHLAMVAPPGASAPTLHAPQARQRGSPPAGGGRPASDAWAAGSYRRPDRVPAHRARVGGGGAAVMGAGGLSGSFAALGGRLSVFLSCLNPLRADPAASLLPPLAMIDPDASPAFIVREPHELRSLAVVLGRWSCRGWRTRNRLRPCPPRSPGFPCCRHHRRRSPASRSLGPPSLCTPSTGSRHAQHLGTDQMQ